ncbi:MAG: hypothetical protein IJ996_03225, partial [Clostridia bacterium]|nr:hypothetical protein [Clostridia bacterium]
LFGVPVGVLLAQSMVLFALGQRKRLTYAFAHLVPTSTNTPSHSSLTPYTSKKRPHKGAFFGAPGETRTHNEGVGDDFAYNFFA